MAKAPVVPEMPLHCGMNFVRAASKNSLKSLQQQTEPCGVNAPLDRPLYCHNITLKGHWPFLVLSFQHRVMKNCLKLMVSVSVVKVVQSNPIFIWSSWSHFIDFEGNLCFEVLPSYDPRFEVVPSIVWPWLWEFYAIYLLSAWWAAHARGEETLPVDISTTTAKIKKLLLRIVVNIVIDMYHYFRWWNGVSLCECRRLLLTVGVMDYAHKKEQNLTADISTTTKEVKKRLLTVVHNGVGYRLRQVCVKTELFWGSWFFSREGTPIGRHFLAGS